MDVSGGESQKLAIARAVYKNSPVLVLDEPTAALSPNAEYELYKRFHEICDKKPRCLFLTVSEAVGFVTEWWCLKGEV